MRRRVETYKVLHNEKHHNFLICPKYLFEDKLKFVYMINGKEAEKLVSLKKIGPYLKTRRLYKYDEEDMNYDYKGWAYEVPDSVIFSA